MTATRFLAVDWGTTRVRAWVVEGGKAAASETFPFGVSRLAPGEAARRFDDTVRPALDARDLPAILCGMIGSNLGWEPAPYADCPADIDTLGRQLLHVRTPGPPVIIVPGLRCQRPDGGPDVMRGEETQILGWAALQPATAATERLICHPGTHAKWVRLERGRITRFVTSMTGELFDVLRRHSVLQVRDSDDDDSAFDEGLAAAADGSALASRLFTARSRVVGGDMAPERVKSYLSGLLIGAEVAGVPPLMGADRSEPVVLIGDPDLCRRYRRALEARGVETSFHDGALAAVAGLGALLERAR